MLDWYSKVAAMDLAEMIECCMSLPEVEETTPFGPDALVYKVAGKMFAVTDPLRVPVSMNLKCDPDRALDLRDKYDAIQPGWHMNKRHWNTVELNGSLPTPLLHDLVEHSYRLVVAGLKKDQRKRVEDRLDRS
jgi:predicted DNA-binding protein (MmcQ/YjbR family)